MDWILGIVAVGVFWDSYHFRDRSHPLNELTVEEFKDEIDELKSEIESLNSEIAYLKDKLRESEIKLASEDLLVP